MSQIQKAQGIIIKKIDYKENANLITLLTKEGKVSLIVRGAKKINSVMRNYTNLFSVIDYNATANLSLNTLTEATVVNSFVNIMSDMDKLNVGMVILEKINIFSDEIINKELFYDFIKLIFDKLNNTEYPYSLMCLFDLKLLYLLGVSPEFRECVICGNKDIEDGKFSVENGGVICNKHLINYVNLDDVETKALKLIYYIKPDKIDDEFLKLIKDYEQNIMKTIDSFYERHLDFHSKAKKIMKTII